MSGATAPASTRLRGQNNVQGGGDMGAIPNKFPGGQDVEDPELRAKFERAYGRSIPPKRGWHLSQMFEAMAHGELRTLYVIGENPVQSEADCQRATSLIDQLDHFVVQDILLTKTAERAHVVLPAAASWCESEGTVTSSERRVQRVRKALDPPGQARDDIAILCELARRLGKEWGNPSSEQVWDEVRALSSWHAGMSYKRLEALNGIQWPCPSEDHPGSPFLHGRLWEDPITGPRAPFIPVAFEPPVDEVNAEFPLRLTTGRQLDSFNTGVQTEGYASPLQTRRADRAGTGRRRPPRVPRRRACADRLAPGSGRRAGALRSRPETGARVHDAAFPGRGADELPHHRRDGSEVGHGGIQGDRGARREACAGRRRGNNHGTGRDRCRDSASGTITSRL